MKQIVIVYIYIHTVEKINLIKAILMELNINVFRGILAYIQNIYLNKWIHILNLWSVLKYFQN